MKVSMKVSMKSDNYMKNENFELLLPVGQKEMALAAIHNGADAIFMGFPGFNARGRSYDFELNELAEIISICHLNSVKVNLAFNIVIFENELPSVLEAIYKVLPLKPDALIIQDLGLIKIVKKIAPEQVVHASTQMTITNDLAIHLLQDLNIKRFVLGRENSISEIKLIKERTEKELEVFVHGALCVSYSGQCFTSESIGGRSANRGQCAQSCRFEYDLIVDGNKKNMIGRQYLVSPQDLCGIAEIPELMKIGVKSFKVEGRLKTPEYVASVASSFRKAISAEMHRNPLSNKQLSIEKNKMAVNYSRGFFPGWLHGVNHQKLVDGHFSSHRGVLIGQILEIKQNKLLIQLNNPEWHDLQNGDGLLWDDLGKASGSFIFSIEKISEQIFLIGVANDTQLNNSLKGAQLFLNHDKDLKKQIQKSFQDKTFFKKNNIYAHVKIEIGKPLFCQLSDGKWTVDVYSEILVSEAKNKPVSEDTIKEELNSLAGSVFQFKDLQNDIKIEFLGTDKIFIPHGEIKKCRQNAIKALTELRSQSRVDFYNQNDELKSYSLVELENEFQSNKKIDFKTTSNNNNNNNSVSEENFKNSQLKFNLLLRNKQQVSDLLEQLQKNQIVKSFINSICLDFEFGRDYIESIDSIKKMNIFSGIATTRILKPQEYQNLKIINGLNPDFILVRNLGALEFFRNKNDCQSQLHGDFSLNVTNQFTFSYLLSKGLSSICLSYDMNSDQTMHLLKKIDAQKAEIIAHQFMPSFHMEHCVYAAFLSQGSSFKDCGKPCEKHQVQLRDQFGNQHLIKPDHECRNTMYNANAQTAISYLAEWRNLGLGAIRYEALHESGLEIYEKIGVYRDYLLGEATLSQSLNILKDKESYGLTTMHLSRSDDYQSRKKDHSFDKRG